MVRANTVYNYSAKFLREKTFTNFVVLEPPAKVFSMKFGCAVPTYDRQIGFIIPRKFLRKMVTLYRSVKVFSLESFPPRIRHSVAFILSYHSP